MVRLNKSKKLPDKSCLSFKDDKTWHAFDTQYEPHIASVLKFVNVGNPSVAGGSKSTKKG